MSLTAEQLRHAVLRETGIGYGPHNGVYTIDARNTTTITIGELANTNLSGEESVNLWAFLPDEATATDREKPLARTTVATGIVTNAGIAWSGSGSGGDQAEIIKYISPTELFNVTVETLQRLPQRVLVPLGAFTDSDMDTTTDGSSYTASSASLSKVTTAANVHSGVRSLFVNLTGANGYAESAAVRVNPGEMVYVSAVLRADVGTASLILWDNTNSAAIGTAITYTGERFAHIWRYESVPDTCEEITVRLAGVAATDDVYVDHVCGPYVMNTSQVRAPDWLDEDFRLKKVRRAGYWNMLEAQIEDASSRRFRDWLLGTEVSYENIPGATWENTLSLPYGLPSEDIWIEADRRAYDLTSGTWANTAAGESLTTGAPRDELIHSVSVAVCEYILSAVDPDARPVQAALDRNQRKLAAILHAKTKELPVQRLRTHRGYAPV